MEKKRQRRLVLSLAAGLVGAFLVNAVPERTEYTENIYREHGTDHCLVGIFISEILLCGKT